MILLHNTGRRTKLTALCFPSIQQAIFNMSWKTKTVRLRGRLQLNASKRSVKEGQEANPPKYAE